MAFTTAQVNPFFSEAVLGSILAFHLGLQEGGSVQNFPAGTSACSPAFLSKTFWPGRAGGVRRVVRRWEREWESLQIWAEFLSRLGCGVMRCIPVRKASEG